MNFLKQLVLKYDVENKVYFFWDKNINHSGNSASKIIYQYNLIVKYYKMKKDIINKFDESKYLITDTWYKITIIPKEIISYNSVTFNRSSKLETSFYDVQIDFVKEHAMASNPKQIYSKALRFFITIKKHQIKAYLYKLQKLNFDFFDVKFYNFEVKIFLKDHPQIKMFSITANDEGY